MRWEGHMAPTWERCVQGFGRRPEGRRPLGSPRCRWEDNVRNGEAWAGLIWLRIGTGGGRL